MMRTKAPRKIYFVEKKFQASFIIKFLALLLVGTVIFDVAAYFILNKRLEDTLYSAHLTIKSVGEMLLPTLVSLSLIFIILLGLAVLIMTLIVSHYIAGPLFAIRRYIENIGAGNLDFDARLRGRDQTMPLIVTLAQSLEKLNAAIVGIQDSGNALHEKAQQLASAVSGAESLPEEVRTDAAQIVDLAAEVKDKASSFKTRRSGVSS